MNFDQDLARARRERWVEAHGVVVVEGRRPCIQRLRDPYHHCGTRCLRGVYPRVIDHPEWWRAPGGGLVLTAHPYGQRERGAQGDDVPVTLDAGQMAEATALARSLGVNMEADPLGSWYCPGGTTLLVLWGQAGLAGCFPRQSRKAILEEAETQGYIVARRAQEGTAMGWRRRCDIEGRLYGRIIPRRTWAALDVERPTGSPEMSEVQAAAVQAVLNRYMGKGSFAGYGNNDVYVSAVSVDRAREAMAALLEAVRGDAGAGGEELV